MIYVAPISLKESGRNIPPHPKRVDTLLCEILKSENNPKRIMFKPNFMTLSGRRQVRSRFEAGRRTAASWNLAYHIGC